MAEGQNKIYYLCVPNRQTAVASPYFEQFKKKGVEVLFLHGTIDEYVMNHLDQYKTFRMFPIENPDTDLDKVKTSEDAEKDATDKEAMEGLVQKPLAEDQCKKFSEFLMTALDGKLFEAKVSTRLTNSPAVIVTGHEQSSLHRMMKQMNLVQGKHEESALPKQVLEFNPKHTVIKRLFALSRREDSESVRRSRLLAEQIFDNSLIAAGLLDDPRMMLARLNSLIETALLDVKEETLTTTTTTTTTPVAEEKKDTA